MLLCQSKRPLNYLRKLIRQGGIGRRIQLVGCSPIDITRSISVRFMLDVGYMIEVFVSAGGVFAVAAIDVVLFVIERVDAIVAGASAEMIVTVPSHKHIVSIAAANGIVAWSA